MIKLQDKKILYVLLVCLCAIVICCGLFVGLGQFSQSSKEVAETDSSDDGLALNNNIPNDYKGGSKELDEWLRRPNKGAGTFTLTTNIVWQKTTAETLMGNTYILAAGQTIDGNGHKFNVRPLADEQIIGNNSNWAWGVFLNTNEGVIKNINFVLTKPVTFDGQTHNGWNASGIVVGLNKGTIDNCSVEIPKDIEFSLYSSYKNATYHYDSIGAFAGANDGGTISNSHVIINGLLAQRLGQETNNSSAFMGGFVGSTKGGSFINNRISGTGKFHQFGFTNLTGKAYGYIGGLIGAQRQYDSVTEDFDVAKPKINGFIVSDILLFQHSSLSAGHKYVVMGNNRGEEVGGRKDFKNVYSTDGTHVTITGGDYIKKLDIATKFKDFRFEKDIKTGIVRLTANIYCESNKIPYKIDDKYESYRSFVNIDVSTAGDRKTYWDIPKDGHDRNERTPLQVTLGSVRGYNESNIGNLIINEYGAQVPTPTNNIFNGVEGYNKSNEKFVYKLIRNGNVIDNNSKVVPSKYNFIAVSKNNDGVLYSCDTTKQIVYVPINQKGAIREEVVVNPKRITVDFDQAENVSINNAKVTINGLVSEDTLDYFVDEKFIGKLGNGEHRLLLAGDVKIQSVKYCFSEDLTDREKEKTINAHLVKLPKGVVAGEPTQNKWIVFNGYLSIKDFTIGKIKLKYTPPSFGNIVEQMAVDGGGNVVNTIENGNVLYSTISINSKLTNVALGESRVRDFAVTVDNGSGQGGSTNSYKYNTQLNLTTTVQAGKVFIGWTNNGTYVSYNMNYSPKVTDTMNIVANHVENNEHIKVTVKNIFSVKQDFVFYVENGTQPEALKQMLNTDTYLGGAQAYYTLKDWEIEIDDDGYRARPIMTCGKLMKVTINGIVKNISYNTKFTATLDSGKTAWKVNGVVISKQAKLEMFILQDTTIEMVNEEVNAQDKVVALAEKDTNNVFISGQIYMPNVDLTGAVIKVYFQQVIKDGIISSCQLGKWSVSNNMAQFVLRLNNNVFEPNGVIGKAKYKVYIEVTVGGKTITSDVIDGK